MTFLKRYWRFGQDHLKRGAHVCFLQVSSVGRAISFSDDHVRVYLRIAIIKRDVANERQHFYLFMDLSGGFVLFRFPV